MSQIYLQINPTDNLLVALQDLPKGTIIQHNGNEITLQDDIAAKHKFTTEAIPKEGKATMYGVLVGIASQDIPKGGLIHTFNLHHASQDFNGKLKEYSWSSPDVSKYKNRTFNVYHRADGQVGTQNYWLVIPLVFCENRNIELLKTMGARLHFQVEEINEQLVQNEIISSTLIRNNITEQQIKKANNLLGYAYNFEGFVVRGNQLGRTIGYPTANLHINDEEKLIPSNGVYAVKVKGACTNHAILDGMMNIGIRPTVDGQKKVIEVHIFNFDQDIYEQYITVMVYEFIRGEVKFDGLDALKNQLGQDKITASSILAKYEEKLD